MDILSDVNIKAYNEAKAKGVFNGLDEIAWVAFVDGVFVGSADSLQGLNVFMEKGKDLFYMQPNVPEVEISVPTVLSVEDVNQKQ